VRSRSLRTDAFQSFPAKKWISKRCDSFVAWRFVSAFEYLAGRIIGDKFPQPHLWFGTSTYCRMLIIRQLQRHSWFK
jgi:hypothetical protein